MSLAKEEIKELENKISEYSSSLYNKYPIFFKNINYTNALASYICSICEDLLKEDDEYIYENEIDFLSLVNYCENITNSIGIDYKNMFQKKLSDGTINFGTSKDGSYSYTKIENNHTDIYVDRNYTIEDIVKTIHELFHDLHFSKFNEKLDDESCMFYSEFIALIGDLYSVFYLYKNGLLKKDCVTYIKKLFNTLNGYANVALIEGVTLDMYDKMQSLDEKSVLEYIKMTNSPEEYSIIPELNKQIKEYDYHFTAPYVYGFIFSFLISDNMVKDSFYRENFKKVMENIEKYDFKEILSNFGIKGVLTNPDKLYEAVLYIYNLLEVMINKNKIDFKVPKGELW